MIVIGVHLEVRHVSTEDGGNHGYQAEGHRACAVAVIRGTAVRAGFDGEDRCTLLGARAGVRAGTGHRCDVARNFHHGFQAGILGAGATCGVVCGKFVQAVFRAAEGAVRARVTREGVQSSEAADENCEEEQSIHVV